MARVVDFCPSEDDDLPDMSTVLSKPADKAARQSPHRRNLVPKSATKSVGRKIRRLEPNGQLKGNLLFQPHDSDEDKSFESPKRSPMKKSGLEAKTPGKSFPNRSIFDDDSPPATVRTARKQIANRSIFDEETPPATRTARARRTKIKTIVEDETSESDSQHDAVVDQLLQTPAIRRARLAEQSQSRRQEPQLSQEDIDRQEAEAQLLQEASCVSFGSEQPSFGADGMSAQSAVSGSVAERSESSDLSSIDESVEESAEGISQASGSAANEGNDEGSNEGLSEEFTDSNDESGSYNASEESFESANHDTSSASFASLNPTKRVQTNKAGSTTHVDILKPRDANLLGSSPNSSPRPQLAPSRSDENSFDLAVHLSKLRLDPPTTEEQENRPSTPPHQTPSKSAPPKGLVSPSKRAALIPQTPHRPSGDTFWSQDFVNDWNDEHSPRKLAFPSVKKSPSKSSPKKEGKRDFESKRHSVAEQFLQELDERITDGKIAKLAASTGGVKLIWSRTLNTTAGRANWKRETIRTKESDGTEVDVKYNHHASIDLAEKVIDDEERLLNVVAHEFCHLANFMVSGITNNPHGKEFKAWASKTTKTFGDRGVKVTTKHTYDIDYKYIWSCAECNSEYKRHSKSIDPQRHRCGSCKGTLKQIKPVPRGGGKPTEYQTFVKEQMKIVKQENPGIAQKDVMKVVAAKWAAKRTAAKEAEIEAKVETTVTEDALVTSVVDLTLDAQ